MNLSRIILAKGLPQYKVFKESTNRQYTSTKMHFILLILSVYSYSRTLNETADQPRFLVSDNVSSACWSRHYWAQRHTWYRDFLFKLKDSWRSLRHSRTWADWDTASSRARALWRTSSFIWAYMFSAFWYFSSTISPSSGFNSFSCGPIFSSLSIWGLCSAMDSLNCYVKKYGLK